jgi:glucan 1,3-beta-glucosidase
MGDESYNTTYANILYDRPNTTYGDPTFDNCATQGQSSSGQCYRAWGHHAINSSNIVIHGSALWVFFDGMDDNKWQDASCTRYGGICELNMVYLDGAASTFMYSLGTKSTTNLVYDITGGGSNITTQEDNPGAWGAVVAAYLVDSDIEENT